MAGHFLRLKGALLAGSFRQSWQQTVGFVVMLVVGVPAALVFAALLYVSSRMQDYGGPLAILFLSVVTVAWAVLPPVMFGIDNTLDPKRLALLPLTTRQLAVGLLVAGAAGIGAFLTAALITGAVLGQATSWSAALVGVVAGLGHLLWCLVLGRAVTTALSARLRSRKGKDLSTVLLALSGLIVVAAAQLPNLLMVNGSIEARSIGELIDRFTVVTEVLSWTPLGWGPGAIVAASDGQVVGSLLRLVLLGGAIWLAMIWWLRSLRTTLETAEAVRSDAVDTADLIPRWLRWIPDPSLAALVSKDLRYLWRVPAQRAQWVIMPLMIVPLLSVVFFLEPLQRPELTLMAAAMPMLLSLTSINAFGHDRDAAWLYVAASVPGGRALLSKNIAAAFVVVPVTVVVGVGIAMLAEGFAYLPGALLAGAGLFLLTLSIMNAASVMLPTGFPESTTNLWAASGGQGCATSLLQILGFMVLGILTLPVVIGSFLVGDLFDVTTTAGLIGGLATVAWGALWWWLSLKLGTTWLRHRAPEWVAALRTDR